MTTPRRASADAADRDRIRTDLAHSYVVEAAAGTGKTTELVARIISVLASGHAGATIDKIVAVTFTEKAAGELKLRLREELEAARQREIGDRRDRLEQSLRYLEEARVSTIHGFCADLLRERPVEARIDPQFQVLTEDQASRLYDLAFEAWLQEQLGDPGDGVRRSLRRPARRNFGADIDEDGPVERLRRAGKALLEWRDHPARWRTDPFDREGEIRQLVIRLADFAQMSIGTGVGQRRPLSRHDARADGRSGHRRRPRACRRSRRAGGAAGRSASRSRVRQAPQGKRRRLQQTAHPRSRMGSPAGAVRRRWASSNAAPTPTWPRPCSRTCAPASSGTTR